MCNSLTKIVIFIAWKCPYLELFWSAFSCIQTEYVEMLSIQAEYVEIQSISPYSVQMWVNTDQNNSEYGRFLRSVY